jgi:L-ascorbate metabolism protein UlaG (beta-lactamase superfamily)
LLDDGQDQILIDGFFSRQRYSFLFGKFSPKLDQISQTVATTGVCIHGVRPIHPDCLKNGGRLRLIIPAHGHYDHALDAGVLALWSGATIVADSSIDAVIEASKELDAQALHITEWREPKVHIPGTETVQSLPRFGAFSITLYQSQHLKLLGIPIAPGETKEIAFPASLRDMKAGSVFNILIEHNGKKILILPSASLPALREARFPKEVDTVFLGIGGLDINGKHVASKYLKILLEKTKTQKIFLIHWDSDRHQFDFAKPSFIISRERIMQIVIDALVSTAQHQNIDLTLPPALEKFSPFR